MTASSFCLLDEQFAQVLCAVLEPNSTPSGTMTAARPPGLSRRKKRARKSNSVFLVFTTLLQVPGAVLVLDEPAKGGLPDEVYFSSSPA